MGTSVSNVGGEVVQPDPDKKTDVLNLDTMIAEAKASGFEQGFLSDLSDLFSKNVKIKKGALDEALKKVTADASDPEALAKYQAALAEYTLYRNAQSNAVKAYKDVDANTIRNFN